MDIYDSLYQKTNYVTAKQVAAKFHSEDYVTLT